MPRRCALGCPPSTRGLLHIFPNQNKYPEQFKAWVKIVTGNEDCDNFDYKKYRVCDRHFTDKHRTRSSRLSVLAIPSLFLPEGDANLKFHRYPMPSKHGLTKARVWAEYCYPDKDWSTEESLKTLYSQHKMICNKHFDASSYTSSARKRLNNFAIPAGAQDILSKYRKDTFSLDSESTQVTSIEKPIKKVSSIGTDVANNTHDTNTIDNDNPILNDNLDKADSEACVTIKDVPPETPKEFSWQQSEATVDLAEEVGEGETEYLQDDLSLYCSDDEENQTLYGYREDPVEHAGFQCNVCNKDIVGFRYVCVQCLDFDLCGGCEASAAHDQHYVLRIPGPRPYQEVQSILARIRKHLMASTDPIQVADDAISIKSEVKEEDEETIRQEVDPQTAQEETEDDDTDKENQERSEDEEESSQDEGLFQTHSTTDTETVDDSEAEWTPSNEDLDNIETTDHENAPSNTTRHTRTRQANIKPITEKMPTRSNIEQTSQEQILQTKYIKVKPLTSITKLKPIIIQRNSGANITIPLSLSKANPRILLNILKDKLIETKMAENVCVKKRRIITDQSEIDKFSKMYPSVKKVCIPVVSEKLLKIAGDHRQPVSVTSVSASTSITKDNIDR